ncbi:hydrolase [Baekduia alba]|uniref:choice-of-anchor D domain-containing protein n=1 Tax=Baekduia alba TaxID=2997333 RepID=UPI0023403802|nr:choice-of-anchor D domain-containing protein [Baekduia alba]WCB96960.1 hydrolase [Baekduia alba]
MPRIALLCALVAAALGIAIPLTASAADDSRPTFTSSGTLTFDFVAVGQSATKTVKISNPSKSALTIANVDFSGPDTADFAMTQNTCVGAKLANGSSCAITVRFAPVVSGTRVASLRFTDDTPCKNFVTIAGSGTDTPQAARAFGAACDQAVEQVTTPGQTVTQTTTTTTTTTTAVPVPTIDGQAAISLPSSCVSKRRITFHLAAPAGKIFKKVTVRLGGKTFKTLKGKAIKSTVSLKGLPRGRFTLTIVGTLNSGKTVKQTRHYVTCVANKK